MKSFIAIVSTFAVASLFGTVNGAQSAIACTMIYKYCPEGQYWGSINGGCPDCQQCPLKKIVCPNGATPVANPREENKCQTWSCPEPLICPAIYKYCPVGQYWGSVNGGCPDCQECPLINVVCPNEATPVANPLEENKCQTWSCPEPLICPAIYKYCPVGQYWGSVNGGCPDCQECPLAKIGCPNGATPVANPREENTCQTWSCPKPIMCPAYIKFCPEGQYWGSVNGKCPNCQPCPLVKPFCPTGSTPVKNPIQQNKCATFSCEKLYTIDPIRPLPATV